MTDIDEKIRQALSEEDKKLAEEIDEQSGFFEVLGLTLSGKQAWYTVAIWVIGIANIVAFIFFVTQFVATEDIRMSLNYSLATIGCMCIHVIIKVQGFQQMLRVEMLQQIKRLEMRVMLAMEKSEK